MRCRPPLQVRTRHSLDLGPCCFAACNLMAASLLASAHFRQCAGDKPWQREQGKDEALAQGTAIGVPVHDLHGLHQRGPAQKKLS